LFFFEKNEESGSKDPIPCFSLEKKRRIGFKRPDSLFFFKKNEESGSKDPVPCFSLEKNEESGSKDPIPY